MVTDESGGTPMGMSTWMIAEGLHPKEAGSRAAMPEDVTTTAVRAAAARRNLHLADGLAFFPEGASASRVSSEYSVCSDAMGCTPAALSGP